MQRFQLFSFNIAVESANRLRHHARTPLSRLNLSYATNLAALAQRKQYPIARSASSRVPLPAHRFSPQLGINNTHLSSLYT